MTTLSLSDAIAWVAAVFVRNGCSAGCAQSVARALVAAEADGLKGHGLSRISTYLQMMRSGKIDGAARPSSTRPRPGVLAIDAANGFAYPAIDLAVAELPALAAGQGIAAASIRRSVFEASGFVTRRMVDGERWIKGERAQGMQMIGACRW